MDIISTNQRISPSVLIGLSLGYFMVLLDTTIVVVALPNIESDLGGGLSALQWVVNGYTLTFAAFLLTGGWLSDRFGARKVFLWGLATFGLLSAVTAVAQSIVALVALRLLLGVAGALLLPSSLAVITHLYTDPALRARALGNWAAVTGFALVCGPVLGGVLVQTVGWRGIFVVNLPLAAISLGITWRRTTEVSLKPRRRLDLAGQVLAIVALGAIIFAMIEGPDLGWSAPETIIAIALAVLALLLFILFERRRGDNAMLPLRIFRNRQLSASMGAGLLANFGLSGLLFVLSLFFQEGRHYSALVTGLMFLPLTLPTAFNPIYAGKLVARIGPRAPATLGMCLMAVGALAQAPFTGSATADQIATAAGLLIFGFGVSFTLPSLVAATAQAVPLELAGIGAGALNSMRQIGASLGVALLGLTLTASTTVEQGTMLALTISGGIFIAGAFLVRANLQTKKG
ncbi:DHA2 family methylenomycin A resistance protein-like MFS transporter [Leifsonia sp. EB41]|uniref:MFS transporter n=1 Tax=Leifsonia sp. EB41 TaxID=3156260 RepID=UPI003512AF8E